VQRCDVGRATTAIREFLAQSGQDEPSVDDENVNRPGRYSPAMPDRCGTDNFVEYAMKHYGMTPDQVLDTPIALFHQLYREHLLATEDGELAVFAPSDSLLNSTHV
jgi:hypothetical protein